MSFAEDLSTFLVDFGVTCTSGATTALGVLDMPSQVVAGDMVLTTDYVLTALATDFGSLKYQDTITVAGTAYMVRETRFIDDGAFVEIGLQKT